MLPIVNASQEINTACNVLAICDKKPAICRGGDAPGRAAETVARALGATSITTRNTDLNRLREANANGYPLRYKPVKSARLRTTSVIF